MLPIQSTRLSRILARTLLVLIPVVLILAGLSIGVSDVPAARRAVCSGTIFRDYDADGSRDAREPGVADVAVAAYDASGLVATAVSLNDGTYTLTITDGLSVRIEFTALPGGFFSGPFGPDSATSITFVDSTTCSADFGVNIPAHYCQDNPDLATNCYVFGAQTGVANPVLIEFPYSAGGTSLPAIDQPPTHTVDATAAQIGTTWGLAYQRTSNSLFAAAFMKRHAGFGPGGPGAIYRIDRAGSAAPSLFLDLNILFPGSAGADPHGVPDYFVDQNSWDAVGKISLGDIDLSEDEQTLWAMNLNDRQLYEIPIGVPPVAPPAASIGRFAAPNPCAVPGDMRPFGLGVRDGLVYVGLVCTAESSGSPADMAAHIYSFNPTTDLYSATPVLSFDLDYPRGCAVRVGMACANAEWNPWEPIFTIINTPFSGTSPFEYIYPQPWLTDITFDNGEMVLGLRDRFADQMGYLKQGTNPADPTLRTGDAAGDLLRACPSGPGTWSIENNAACGGVGPTNPATGMGPGAPGGEFYFEENYPYHDEVSLGGLAQVPGQPDVVQTMYDPVFDTDEAFDGGILWTNNAAGTRTKTHRIFNTDTADPLTFGKAGGLGDLEVLCNAAPIEIGNRVWRDRTDLTRDGIQGPTQVISSTDREEPIPGVTVHLYLGSTLVATDTTDAQGEYIFNASNVPGGLLPFTTYLIRLDDPADYGAGGELQGLTVTLGNQGANDAIDSDGIVVNSYPQITAVTRNYGDNDHTFDFGFHNIPTAVELLYFRVESVNGQQVELGWATAVEIDNFGFNLYRAPENDFNRAEPIHFEPSAIQGNGPGATYAYVDTAPAEGIWWYWLADLDTQGRETLHSPVNAVVGLDALLTQRIYLPLVLR
ncbi:MAG TPA: SdrD B-like domain-containing protein [Anaerolineae bacterium]|nr:SdrD B-like domain-containing protein [Anaerolineae bacterium]